MVNRVGDLEVEQDLSFEKREWRGQLFGRAVMLVIIVGALLGFFGAGPLSLTEVRDETGNFAITYERFGRRGSTTNLTLQVAPDAITNGTAALWISSQYLERFQVNAITPAPDQVVARDGGYIYSFLVEDTNETLTATFNFTIDSMGPVTGEVGFAGGEPVELEHFFTP